MFHAAFDVASAYNAILMLMAGLFLCAIGGGFLSNILYWRIKGRPVRAVVESIQKHGNMYRPVLGYAIDGVQPKIRDEIEGELVPGGFGLDFLPAGVHFGCRRQS